MGLTMNDIEHLLDDLISTQKEICRILIFFKHVVVGLICVAVFILVIFFGFWFSVLWSLSQITSQVFR